jgi:transposase
MIWVPSTELLSFYLSVSLPGCVNHPWRGLGQILLSMPPIGPVQATTIIATVGNIANFEKASELKCYFGWAPRQEQTDISFDRTTLASRGVRPMKQMLYLMAARSTTFECE